MREVLEAVRTTDFSIGQGDPYGRYLRQLSDSIPWMKRALNHQMLRYYTFRNDGPMMVEYATRMLSGLPESTEYLSALAKGYLLTGDDSKAIDTWQKILGIDPATTPALPRAGQLLHAHGRHHYSPQVSATGTTNTPHPIRGQGITMTRFANFNKFIFANKTK